MSDRLARVLQILTSVYGEAFTADHIVREPTPEDEMPEGTRFVVWDEGPCSAPDADDVDRWGWATDFCRLVSDDLREHVRPMTLTALIIYPDHSATHTESEQ